MATRLAFRSVIQIEGPDARPFLDGLLTQRMDLVGDDGWTYAGLLSPQGKLAADLFLRAEGDALLIDAPAQARGELVRRLGLYRLRSRVEIMPRDDVEILWSPEPLPGGAADPRLPDAALGYRAVAASGRSESEDASAFHAQRIAAGVPEPCLDAEIEEVFALEALFEELGGVDFRKGCFVGQENVSRMKRRATTRRKFCRMTRPSGVHDGAAVASSSGAELGAVRASSGNWALALLRLDRAAEAMEAGEILLAGGIEVRLSPPPWLLLPAKGGA